MTAAVPEPVATLEVLDLQIEISQAITDLGALAGLVADLADTHVRGLGFLTHDALQALGEQTRKERRIRNENARKGFPEPSGDIPVPGNIKALSLEAEISFTLHHLNARIIRTLRRAGVCALTRPLPIDPDVYVLLGQLRTLAYAAPSPSLLLDVRDELDELIYRSTQLVDGNDKALLPVGCPHCDRRTLVVYFADGIIRCDRDPKTGHYHPCTCPDSYCQCHHKPVSFRHAWHRTQTTSSTGWYALADRLNLNRIK